MEIGHVMYMANRVMKDNHVVSLYGNEPLNRVIELENILGLRLCYSVLYDGSIVQFCFIEGRMAYVFDNDRKPNMNFLFNFPSIFQGEFLVKDRKPRYPSLSQIFRLTMSYMDEMKSGGTLTGQHPEITIPEFRTLKELKMKMELSGHGLRYFQK